MDVSLGIKKKPKKRKLKNGDSKNKHSKIKKFRIKSETEDNPIIKKEIDLFENGFEDQSVNIDGFKKRTRKGIKNIRNSFLRCIFCLLLKKLNIFYIKIYLKLLKLLIKLIILIFFIKNQ